MIATFHCQLTSRTPVSNILTPVTTQWLAKWRRASSARSLRASQSLQAPRALRALGLSSKLQANPCSRVGDIPCFKLFESDKTLAFLDINPLSRGHAVRSCGPQLPYYIQCQAHTIILRIARHSQDPRREVDRHPRRPSVRDPGTHHRAQYTLEQL